MSENWFENKIDEIAVKNEKQSIEKKFVDTDLQKNIMYFKQQFGDAFDV